MTFKQRVEKIFQSRLIDIDQMALYLKRMGYMGKFDEPKKVELFGAILEMVATIEERITVYEKKLEELTTAMSILSERAENERPANTPEVETVEIDQKPALNTEDPDTSGNKKDLDDQKVTCEVCAKEFKTENALTAHKRVHK